MYFLEYTLTQNFTVENAKQVLTKKIQFNNLLTCSRKKMNKEIFNEMKIIYSVHLYKYICYNLILKNNFKFENIGLLVWK